MLGGRDTGPLSPWKLLQKHGCHRFLVISKRKDVKSKNIPVSFLQKAYRFYNKQGQELEEENWHFFFFALHNFSDKSKRFQHHFCDKLYPYLWNFCKFSINHVHFPVIFIEISFCLACWQSGEQFLFANAAFSLATEKWQC